MNDETIYIGRKEETIFPQSAKGKKMAVEYAERLKEKGMFTGWMEDTVQIIVKSYTRFAVWENGEEVDE